MDEVQKKVYKTKKDHRDNVTRGSPFTQEIQDKPILLNFYLLTLEAYDSGADLVEHVAAFRA